MPTTISELQSRGCIHDASNLDELSKELERNSLSFYCGFDPTADSLHCGSMLPLLIMRRLQQQGHKPIVLIGAATGMIGDPSGKSEERVLLSEEVLSKNVAGIEKQISLFLDSEGKNGFELVKNDQWLCKLPYIDFLRDVGKHFTVNSMIAKDSVKTRLDTREQGISYTEFSYMLLQAYDFYWLYQNKDCRLQVGGSDQWGNITAGLELIRKKSSANSLQAFGLTFPLLTTSTGAKFGKTEAGAVWLDPKKTSPYAFYQYWLNSQDADVLTYLKLFTEIRDSELADLAKSVETAPEKREAQQFLASSLTTLIHGTGETAKAQSASKVLFGESIEGLDSSTLLEIFCEVESTEVSKSDLGSGISLQDLLVKTGLAKSKGAARRLIEGGGIYLNNQRTEDFQNLVSKEQFIDQSLLVIRSGKKRYHLVRLT